MLCLAGKTVVGTLSRSFDRVRRTGGHFNAKIHPGFADRCDKHTGCRDVKMPLRQSSYYMEKAYKAFYYRKQRHNVFTKVIRYDYEDPGVQMPETPAKFRNEVIAQ